MAMNSNLLEVAFFLILFLNLLRTYFLINPLLIFIFSTLFIFFVALTLLRYWKVWSFGAGRYLILFVMVILLIFNSLSQNQRIGSIHDGAVLTSSATEAIISLQNPYTANFEHSFANFDYKPPAVVYTHYMYSPVMFLVNIPNEIVSRGLGLKADFRYMLVVAFVSSALAGAYLVRQKILFLILFLLNPIFFEATLYGANEVIILFLIMMAFVACAKQKFSWASIFLAIATGTKLLALPYVPIYFIYVFLKKRDIFIQQLTIFFLVNLVIYLPFALWSFPDLVDDVIFFHLRGGLGSHMIAGFVGVPGVLNALGLINPYSRFPFWIIQLVIAIITLPLFKVLLAKKVDIANLSILSIIYFLALLVFSRIIQTSYIAFISQILILAAFTRTTNRVENY